MGYYTDFVDWTIAVKNQEDLEKLLAEAGSMPYFPLEEDVDTKILETAMYDIPAGYLMIELYSYSMKIYEEKWLPVMAKYCIGEYTTQGEDWDDMKRVVFDGKGGYIECAGQIDWVPL